MKKNGKPADLFHFICQDQYVAAITKECVAWFHDKKFLLKIENEKQKNKKPQKRRGITFSAQATCLTT